MSTAQTEEGPLCGWRAGSPWVTGQATPGSLFLGSWLFRSGCGFGLCHRALVFYVGSHCFFFFHLLPRDPPLDCLTRVPSSRDSYAPTSLPLLLLLLLQLIFLFLLLPLSLLFIFLCSGWVSSFITFLTTEELGSRASPERRNRIYLYRRLR